MLARAQWPTLPEPHEGFLERALRAFEADERIVGAALGGSFVTDAVDEHSDLDFVLAVDPAHWPDILDERRAFAEGLGPLLEAFTGEHVGEPRLLVCLYGPPLLHVDLKFVSLDDVHDRVEDPAIVFQRGRALSEAFERSAAEYPGPDLDWIEARFWIWVHYGATKIERGELFEALNFLAFLRYRVLGPMALASVGSRPEGVRRIETRAPELADRLRNTVGSLDRASCLDALDATVALYADLRVALGEPAGRDDQPTAVEREARRFVARVRDAEVRGAGHREDS